MGVLVSGRAEKRQMIHQSGGFLEETLINCTAALERDNQ